MIVACTKAPRAAELAKVQPDAAAVIPPGPVSWYGVARPGAVSGSAGTTMLQSALATATGAVAVALADADAVADALVDAVGQGAADPVVVGVAVTVGTAVAVADAVGVGVRCLLWRGIRNDNLVADTACVVPAAAADEDGVTDVVAAGAVAAVDAGAVAAVDVDGVAQAPAPCAERLRLPPPEPSIFRPRTRPTTSARARGTAILAARTLWGRADQCALRIQSTSEFCCSAPRRSP